MDKKMLKRLDKARKEQHKEMQETLIKRHNQSFNSNRDKTTAALFSMFLGGIGADQFYLGNTGWGIFNVLFVCTFIPAIRGVINGLILLSMSEADFQIRYNDQ